MLSKQAALVWLAAVTILALGALAVALVAATSAGQARDDVAQLTDHLDGVEPPAHGRHPQS